MTLRDKSVYQNGNGVDLTTIEEGDTVPVRLSEFGRTVATVEHANMAEDEYVLTIDTLYERFERTVNGDVFVQERTELDGHVTKEELSELSVDDAVTIYAKGHEQTARAYITEIDEENNRVAVTGECNCQTLGRWVDHKLVVHPPR